MKKMMVGVVAAVISMAGVAADSGTSEKMPEGAGKLLLKISTVETPDTRTSKTWDPPELPIQNQELPWSEADIARATPDKANKMLEENHAARAKNRQVAAELAYRNWAAADEYFRGVKGKLEGTTYGRQIIMALDKFSGYAGQYFNPNCIEFFHRMDNPEGAKERFLQDMGSPDTLACAYFIKLVFDDPRQESGTVNMNGQQMKNTKYTQTLTYEVQNLSGKMVASGNIRKDKMQRTSNAVAREGAESNIIVDLIDECLAEAAKAINDRFVAVVTVEAVSAQGKKDEDFDAGAASLEIDGVSQQLDTEIAMLKAKHKVVVDLDGYKQKGSTTMDIQKSGPVKVVMASCMCKLTVTLKGPADFVASDATVELVAPGEDGETETLTSGEESSVKMGKYTLKVTAEGYSAKPQPVNLTKNKQQISVTVKKDAAPAAGADANAQ